MDREISARRKKFERLIQQMDKQEVVNQIAIQQDYKIDELKERIQKNDMKSKKVYEAKALILEERERMRRSLAAEK